MPRAAGESDSPAHAFTPIATLKRLHEIRLRQHSTRQHYVSTMTFATHERPWKRITGLVLFFCTSSPPVAANVDVNSGYTLLHPASFHSSWVFQKKTCHQLQSSSSSNRWTTHCSCQLLRHELLMRILDQKSDSRSVCCFYGQRTSDMDVLRIQRTPSWCHPKFIILGDGLELLRMTG